jgi:hypothetical protein
MYGQGRTLRLRQVSITLANEANAHEPSGVRARPTLYTFTQVFIDPDKRGDATLDDAQEIKAELIAQGDDIGDAGALGDRFMLQKYFP